METFQSVNIFYFIILNWTSFKFSTKTMKIFKINFLNSHLKNKTILELCIQNGVIFYLKMCQNEHFKVNAFQIKHYKGTPSRKNINSKFENEIIISESLFPKDEYNSLLYKDWWSDTCFLLRIELRIAKQSAIYTHIFISPAIFAL